MKSGSKIFVWTLYDFANTSFSIVVVTFLYAVYFKKTVAGNAPVGDFYWSLGTSISMLVTALIAPLLGAISDYSAGKKRFLLFFTLLCIIATSLLFFVREGDILAGLILLILANIGFESGIVFYDAFLPEITKEKNYGRVSGYGFAMGYLGSLCTLAIIYPFIKAELIKETFPVAALFFLLFAIPIFLFLKETRRSVSPEVSYLTIGFRRVLSTIRNLRDYRNLSLFLLSFFCYIEGVNTVIFFSGIYAATTLKFTESELLLFFLTVQSTAILGSVLFGILGDSIGQKKSIVISLLIWIVTIFFAYFVENKFAFYFVGLIAGAAMGSSQSTSRSLMSKLTPFEKRTEFFGFYSLFGKSSAIIGPLVFGIISYATGSQRYAILSIIIFFIAGLIILSKVEETPA